MAPKNKTAISSETSDAQQAETNFDFGISLLKAVILDQTNSASTSSIVLSPLFVLCALSQLNLGAKNKTAEEIAKIFGRGKSAEEIANYYGMTYFLKTMEYTSIYEAIRTVCKANGYSILPEFQRLSKQYFGEDCLAGFLTHQTSNVDITSKASTSTDITSIASTFKTPNENIQIMTSFYLVARLHYPTTKEKPFLTSEGNSTEVNLIAQMRGIPKLRYFEDNRVKVIRLSDKGIKLYLGIILPKEQFGLDKLLQSIDGKTVQKWLENAATKKKKRVKVQLPKFTTVSNHSTLDGALKSFGLESMFDRSAADFSGISNGHIWIENVVQEASIRMDEEETKGAAAKAIGLLSHACDSVNALSTKIQFIADHPFLYALVDKQGNLLVVGVFRGNGN